MNWKPLTLTFALIGIVCLACAAPRRKTDDAPPEPPVTECAEPRSQACTMEYIPVCGHLFSGERKTYSNACAACADPDVFGRHSGACKEPDPEESEPPDGGQH